MLDRSLEIRRSLSCTPVHVRSAAHFRVRNKENSRARGPQVDTVQRDCSGEWANLFQGKGGVDALFLNFDRLGYYVWLIETSARPSL